MEGNTVGRVGQRLAMSGAALVMCAAVSGGDGTSTTPDKQPPTPTEPVPEQPPRRPLPPEQFRELTARVIEVKGWAQWRPSDKAPWKNAKENDLLDPGAEIRTGTRSLITLRVGYNAKMIICRSTHVDLSEIVQDGAVLRTRVALRHGRAEFDVYLVGLTNDFVVITPTEVLAVEGTGFAVKWGALEGVEIQSESRDDYRRVDYSRMGLGGTFALLSRFSPVLPSPQLLRAPPREDNGNGNGPERCLPSTCLNTMAHVVQ